MANHIDDATIEYVGILAKLELSGEEKEQAKKDMESMLDYVDKLNELDTSSVEPMSHVFPVKNVFREDVVTNGDGSEDTLKNAPEAQDNAFVVPKTIISEAEDEHFRINCRRIRQEDQRQRDHSCRSNKGST